MEPELRNFLLGRNVPEELITLMENEKIDATVIAGMSSKDLEPFLPKLGDRFATLDFCKRRHVSTTESLVEKLRSTINKQERKRKSKYKLSSSDDEGPKINKKRKLVTPGRTTRQIEVGWFASINGNRHKQIKCAQGGGTRKISMPRTSKKNDIIKKAKELFFPDGVSSLGPSTTFSFDLWDSKRLTVTEDYTVEEIFQITGICRLRFYLVSSQKTATVTSTTSNSVLSNCETEISTRKDDELEKSQDSINYVVTDYELLKILENPENPDPELSYESVVASLFSEENIQNNHHGSPSREINVGEIENTIPADNSTEITLHRGNVFNELLSIYKNLRLSAKDKIVIKMISPNGDQEMGEDIGGVFRDAITEFWTTFYDSCTIGTTLKVPIIRHDFSENDWKAIASVISHGWTIEKYFPIKIAKVFFEYCIQETTSGLTDDFLQFVSDCDCEVLKAALVNFEEVDMGEILEILSTFDSKWLPKKDNIDILIRDIAHKELIQKPMFIIKCWATELRNMMSFEDLQSIYKNSQPTVKNILKIVEPAVPLTSDSEKIYAYLRRFIKESSDETRENFLRFCTGSNIVGCKNIQVSFNDSTGLKRSPIGHTCSGVLELPVQYENFPEFRSEFNSVLMSNVWVIDLI